MKTIIISVLAFVIVYSNLYSQPVEIKGTVINEISGDTLPIVNIYIKGTSKGVVSDVKGYFTIKTHIDSTLVFSFVEMEDYLLKVTKNHASEPLLIKMTPESITQVDVFYYKAKPGGTTFNFKEVDGKELLYIPTNSILDAVTGKASSVLITNSDGMLGSKKNILMRGNSSINAGTGPLIIIDGIKMEQGEAGQDPFSLINQSDVQSILFLKDAKATAMYGQDGSNGVILITTKSGNKGKTMNTLSINSGLGMISKKPSRMNFANTGEYFSLVDLARANTLGSDSLFNPSTVLQFFRNNSDNPIEFISREDALATQTDWFDLALRNSSVKDVNFSSIGGTEKGSYYFSANYKDMKGILLNNDMKTLNTRVNLDINAMKNLKFKTKLMFAYSDNQKADGGAWGGAFGKANREALPWFPVFSTYNASGYWNPMSGNNIAANNDRDMIDKRANQYRGIASVYFIYNVPGIKGLEIKSQVGSDFLQSNDLTWKSEYMEKNGSFASDNTISKQNVTSNIIANYDVTLKEMHDLSFTAGYETFSGKNYEKLLEANNLTTSYHYTGSPQNPAATPLTYSSWVDGELYKKSYLGRADYQFKNKYMIGTSFRRDGSSKFLGENRWSTFSAVSAGWLIHKEDFFKHPAWSMLKLRGSFGQTGNSNIDASVFQHKFSNDARNRYGEQSLIPGGTKIINIGNPLLTWETTNSYDIGIDWGMKKNRYNGSVAYYIQDVFDLLLKTDMPVSSPVESYWKNVGKMRNQDFEMEFYSMNVRDLLSQYSWSTSFNLATNTNMILKLNESNDKILLNDGIITEGHQFKCFYMAEWAGLDKERGVDLIWEINQDKWKDEGIIEKTGRKIPATKTNLENNRIIHENKTPDPKYYGGITNEFSFKNIELNIQLTYMGGYYLYDYIEQRSTQVGNGVYNLDKRLINDSWTTENPDASYPMVRWNYTYPDYWNEDKNDWWDVNDPAYNPSSSDNYNNISSKYSRYLYKGDHIRLKNIMLSYNVPSVLLNKYKINGIKVYTSISNLAVWSFYYKGWDPETGESALPPVRMYNIGMNINF